MIKTLSYIAVVLVVVIAGILIFAATKPDSFRVQRSASIKAPPAKIFALINDLHSHTAWSPWEKKDPAMKRTHSGTASGKGAVYEWDGNKDIGAGRMEIADSSPPNRLVLKMDFIRPFEAHNIAEFTLEPKGDTTYVTWAIYGPSPYMSKLMSIFFSFDKLIGKEFESGLANLKAITEQ